ncbi:MAG: hypothetical protein GTO22_19605 [Gemmatimonadales bacterium]|nr:hypothetical protein [Gemmatimonadales bacterium]
MTNPLGKRLYEVRSALEQVEKELAAGGMAQEDLEDFKMVIDHVRLSVWAIMTAGWSDEYQGLDTLLTKQIVARFRLHRGEDICRTALSDIEAGIIPADSPDLGQFYSTLRETTERVGRVIGRPDVA